MPVSTKLSVDENMNMVGLLRERARLEPERQAYAFLADGERVQDRLSYAELDRKARAVAAMLQDKGAIGRRVILAFPSGLDFIVAFFGCLYAGAIAVPTYPPGHRSRLERLAKIIDDAGAEVALTKNAILTKCRSVMKKDWHQPIQWIAIDEAEEGKANDWMEPSIRGEHLALLQYTSGSTASPRGVMVSHANLWKNEAMIQQAFELTPKSVILSWLPPYHDMGLIGAILQPVYVGATSMLMSPTSFLQSPIRWLRAISENRVSVSGGPNFAFDLCLRKITPDECVGLDLSCWRTAFNGSEPVQVETMQRFNEAFAPSGFAPEAFYPCYGLAEATLIVSGGKPGHRPRTQRVQAAALETNRVVAVQVENERSLELTSCGRALGGQSVAVVKPESLAPAMPGEVGEIWISGPCVTRGYWKRSEETEQTFSATLNEDQRRYLRTGDLGFILDGELFISGRLKELMIFRGRNHYPQDIERTIQNCHPELAHRSGAAFQIRQDGTENLVVMQEIGPECAHQLQQIAHLIRAAIAERHELSLFRLELVRPGTILKTTSGKIRRTDCRQTLLDGKVESVGTWVWDPNDPQTLGHFDDFQTLIPGSTDQEYVRRRLRFHLSSIVHVPAEELNPEVRVIQFGLDSLGAAQFVDRVEEEFRRKISASETLAEESIASLAQKIISQTQEEWSEAPRRAALSVYPLTADQERLWILDQLNRRPQSLHLHAAYRISGSFDRTIFAAALAEMNGRHEILRTTFPVMNGKPCQVVASTDRVKPSITNCTLEPDEKDRPSFSGWIEREVSRPFDIQKETLLRTAILKCDERDSIVLFIMHHLICDALSMRIFLREISAIYSDLKAGTQVSLPALTIQYGDFALAKNKESDKPALSRRIDYWRDHLKNATNLSFPRPAAADQATEPAFIWQHGGFLPERLVERLKQLGCAESATLFMVLLAGWKAALYRRTGWQDLVVSCPSHGRSRATQALIGFFAHPLPFRTNIGPESTFRDAVRGVRKVALEAYANDVCFAAIARASRDSALTRIMFNFLAEPLPDFTLPGLAVSQQQLSYGSEDCDLFLTIIPGDGGLEAHLMSNSARLSESDAADLLACFSMVLEEAAARPDALLEGPQLFRKLVIASTFTAEPIRTSLSFWSEALQLNLECEFAPNEQVFQELLTPGSMLLSNRHGSGLILFRWEDWQNPNSRDPAPANIAQQLAQSLVAAANHLPTSCIIFICPPSDALAQDTAWSQLCKEWEQELREVLAGHDGIRLLTAHDLLRLYPVQQYSDPFNEELARIPYTAELYAALGTASIRELCLMERIFAHKVLVLDCDNTLWTGICGEDGAERISLDEGRLSLQKFVVEQRKAGMVVCLCSKNNEEDVREVFDRRSEMPLRWNDFAAVRINWKPKPENLRSIAEELNLGLDSFIMLDDSTAECAEIEARLPEVLVLELPQDTRMLEEFMAHIWPLDRESAAEAGKDRTLLYQHHQLREDLRKECQTLAGFIESLQIAVSIQAARKSDAERLSELMIRTNQFNATGIRRTRAEIESLLDARESVCMAVRVCDRFGDYGLTGNIIYRAAEQELIVDTFLLSCRVLGKGVEYQMVNELGKIAISQDKEWVVLTCRKTKKNQPIRQFIEQVAALTNVTVEADCMTYRLPSISLSKVTFQATEGVPALSSTDVEETQGAKSFVDRRTILKRIATDWRSPEAILRAAHKKRVARIDRSRPYIAPRTGTEERVAAMVAELLNLEKVGAEDNFFELGGHSLHITQMLATIYQYYQVELPITSMFVESATVARIAELIDQKRMPMPVPN
jgi:FkbH-like protein